MVEGARLESVYMSNRIKGSNPFLSANSNILSEIMDLEIFIKKAISSLFKIKIKMLIFRPNFFGAL